MDEQRVFSLLLILGGLGGLVSASTGSVGSNVGILAAVLVATISLGLIMTGVSWIFQQNVGADVYTRLPAGTLILLGLASILGGLALFYPQRGAVTYDLQVIITAGLVLFGCGLVFGGWRWGREQQMRFPLGLLAGGFVLGVAYILHQNFDIFVTNLLLALIAAVAILATVTIPYFVPARSKTPAGE